MFIASSAIPNQPVNVKVDSKSSRTATISWANGGNGNSIIVGYEVFVTIGETTVTNITCDGVSASEKCNTTNKRVTIGNLYPSREYHVTVIAKNGVGSSENSSQQSFTTDEEGKSLHPFMHEHACPCSTVCWTPQKYAFLPCSHLDFESAAKTAQMTKMTNSRAVFVARIHTC